MRFLPIVGRELRVAARRRSTFQIRFCGALLAALVGGFFLLVSFLPRPIAPSGRPLFAFLMAASFGFAVLSGVLLTADCVSREKREGTLGLLFLTDLNGLDIVTGKFAALALVPLHGVLAVFPVATMAVFMGGVTGGELACGTAVVVNTMFLSLTLGLWVSCLATDDRQAAGLTLLMLAALLSLPLALGWAVGATTATRFLADVRLASPIAVFDQAIGNGGGPATNRFWWAILFQHALAWAFLLLAATTLRQSWCDAEAARVIPDSDPDGTAADRSSVVRARRRRLIGQGHLAWLAWQGAWVRRGVWWVAGLTACAAVAIFSVMIVNQQRFEAAAFAGGVLGIGMVLLKLFLAIHVVYFLQETCRSGAMELVLVTPVSSRALCDGLMTALRAAFVGPYLVLCGVQAATTVTGRILAGGDWPTWWHMVLGGLSGSLLGSLVHGLDLLAVAYHASRTGLTYDRPWKAVLHTTVAVIVLPALFCSYFRAFVDLVIIGSERPRLERFRELARGWYFPRGPLGAGWGVPRV